MEVFADAFKDPQKIEATSSTPVLPGSVKDTLRMELPRPPSAPVILGCGPHTPRTSKKLRVKWQSGISKTLKQLRTARTESSDTKLEPQVHAEEGDAKTRDEDAASSSSSDDSDSSGEFNEDEHSTYATVLTQQEQRKKDIFDMIVNNNRTHFSDMLQDEPQPWINTPLIAQKGQTALHLLAFYDRPMMTEMLLDIDGLDVNVANKNGQTPLYVAVQQENIEIVQRLLQQKSLSVDLPATDGRVPLHIAAASGNGPLLSLLLTAKADVSHTDALGRTPLFCAAEEGQAPAIRALIRHKADVRAASKSGRTPLEVAMADGDVDAVTALILSNADLQGAMQRAKHIPTPMQRLLKPYKDVEDIKQAILDSVGKSCGKLAASIERAGGHMTSTIRQLNHPVNYLFTFAVNNHCYDAAEWLVTHGFPIDSDVDEDGAKQSGLEIMFRQFDEWIYQRDLRSGLRPKTSQKASRKLEKAREFLRNPSNAKLVLGLRVAVKTGYSTIGAVCNINRERGVVSVLHLREHAVPHMPDLSSAWRLLQHCRSVNHDVSTTVRMLRDVVDESMLSRVTESGVRALVRNWRRSKTFSFFYSLVYSVLHTRDLRVDLVSGEMPQSRSEKKSFRYSIYLMVRHQICTRLGQEYCWPADDRTYWPGWHPFLQFFCVAAGLSKWKVAKGLGLAKVSASSLHCPNADDFSLARDGSGALCPRCKAVSAAESFIISVQTDSDTSPPTSSDTSGIESSYDGDDGADSGREKELAGIERVCWAIASTKHQKKTCASLADFRHCLKRLKLTDLKRGCNLLTYTELRRVPEKASLFLSLVVAFLSSPGQNFGLTNYAEAIYVLAHMDFLNHRDAEKHAAIRSAAPPRSWKDFCALGKRSSGKSHATILFSAMLFLDSVHGINVIRQFILPHVKELLQIQFDAARHCTNLLLQVYKKRRKEFRAMYMATLNGIANDTGFKPFIARAHRLSTMCQRQGFDYSQPTDNFVQVYRDANDDNLDDRFKRFILKLAEVTGATTKTIPATKGFHRGMEKAGMCVPLTSASDAKTSSTSAQWSACKITDVRRSMLGYKDMNNALMLLDLLAAATPKGGEMRRQARAAGWNAHKAGIKDTIEILRIKNRFMQPSPTGWADCMINFCFKNTNTKHVCEMQIVHDNMMLVRSKMGGHSEYEQLRSATELLEVTGHGGKIEEIDRKDPPEWSSNTKKIVDAALVDNIVYCARTGVLDADTLAPVSVPESEFTDAQLTRVSEALCAVDPPPETIKAVETIVRQCMDRDFLSFPSVGFDMQSLRQQVRALQSQVQNLLRKQSSPSPVAKFRTHTTT